MSIARSVFEVTTGCGDFRRGRGRRWGEPTRCGLDSSPPLRSVPQSGAKSLSVSRENEVRDFFVDFRALLVDDAAGLAKGSGSKLEPPRGSRGKGACLIKSCKPNRAARRPIKDKHKRSSPYVLLRVSDGPRRLFYLYKRQINLCARMARSPHPPKPCLS